MKIEVEQTIGDVKIRKTIEVDEKCMILGPADFLKTALPLLLNDGVNEALLDDAIVKIDGVTQQATAAHAAVLAAKQETDG